MCFSCDCPSVSHAEKRPVVITIRCQWKRGRGFIIPFFYSPETAAVLTKWDNHHQYNIIILFF